jgi:polar amino acid transport system substrate-binding protein
MANYLRKIQAWCWRSCSRQISPLLWLFLGSSILSNFAKAADLRVLVDLSTDMPMAEIRSDQVVQGIHKDLAIALGKELGRKPQLILMPRNRVAHELEKGHADIACHYRPEWLPGNLDWTLPFMPNGVLLVTDLKTPNPKNLAALKDIPIGTVLGFSYTEVETVLGNQFIRDEAPNATLNLRKLTGGRMHHALVGELFLEYQQRLGLFKTPIHPPLLVTRYVSQCAVSKMSAVKVSQFNLALEALRRKKKLDEIYGRYKINYAAQFP